MKMTNETYNKVKWIVSVVLPAVGVFIGTIGKTYGWEGTETAVTVIAAVTTLLGSTMLYSTSQYNKEDDKND